MEELVKWEWNKWDVEREMREYEWELSFERKDKERVEDKKCGMRE